MMCRAWPDDDDSAVQGISRRTSRRKLRDRRRGRPRAARMMAHSVRVSRVPLGRPMCLKKSCSAPASRIVLTVLYVTKMQLRALQLPMGFASKPHALARTTNGGRRGCGCTG